jgi:hypothetical protein
MPTKAQQVELIEYCTRESMQLNGVNGTLVIGPNGNTIFFPAAGHRLYDDLSSGGSYGYYWSSSLYSGYEDHGWFLYFTWEYWSFSLYYRYLGQSVRAVCP